ncbi:uncharacterized protein A4U43_C04F6500 [Asparagus officinalis]|uniref:AB hydrolase-1 domain-containing protein n=1 Tax=Asparagus officinalis TaxID=4686 RepID=A0A5P1F0K1_ASPOF|nr:uncharacterized protein LOC109836754 isoform X1 [Asparagus officinalis]ONK71253.1 uncharacterized protein A4U43_C04F6500 [Asparagus officinalis]
MLIATLTVTALAVLAGWGYQAIQPPPPKLCGSPNGPPITSPRIQLSDGRFLAYKESGTPKNKAKHKIILVHGFDNCKELILPASQELVCELGVYFLSFDRAGYGDSDPNPKRDAKSEATDIEELADRLDIGLKFYVIGFSMGGYPAWSCLKYIPHRLAGAALVVPVINYWWPSFPANLSKRVYRNLLVQDQITFWIAHNAPSLLCGWMTQKWIPKLSVVEGHPHIFSGDDKEIRQKMAAYAEENGFLNKPRQQGVHESLHRDLMVGFGNWEFDPMNISNPFPDDEGSVHIWQGYDDRLIPVDLQRFLVKKLPWIQYHENPKGGHLFFWTKEWSDAILGSLLRGQMPTAT